MRTPDPLRSERGRATIRIASGAASCAPAPVRPAALEARSEARTSSVSARRLARPEQLVLLFADDVDLDLSRRVDSAPLVSSGLRSLCEEELDGATISLDDVDD